MIKTCTSELEVNQQIEHPSLLFNTWWEVPTR